MHSPYREALKSSAKAWMVGGQFGGHYRYWVAMPNAKHKLTDRNKGVLAGRRRCQIRYWPEEAMQLRGHDPVPFFVQAETASRGLRPRSSLFRIRARAVRDRHHGDDLLAVHLLHTEHDDARPMLLPLDLAAVCLALPQAGVADHQAGDRNLVVRRA